MARGRAKGSWRSVPVLADSELLALLLRTGLRGKNVLQLAQELLDRFEGLSDLLHAGLDDLKQVKGLGGTAKCAELAAVLELARRAMAERLKERTVFDSPVTVTQYLQLHLAARPHGVCRPVPGCPVPPDRDGRAFSRTLTQTSVYPREVVTRALHHHAAVVVLAHNHERLGGAFARRSVTHPDPQGRAGAGRRVVLDHVIVARGGTLSMAERGLI